MVEMWATPLLGAPGLDLELGGWIGYNGVPWWNLYMDFLF